MGPPAGWRDCPAITETLIEGTFVAFKTPLNGANGIFTVKTIIDHAKRKKWDLGLWIDLSNTSKNYQPCQVESMGIKYIKLNAVGGRSPPLDDLQKFNSFCRDFLAENPQKVIGVHCTHGFNRTGYFICSFLTLVKGVSAREALEKFAEQRSPGIYRQKLVNEFIWNFGKLGGAPPQVTQPTWDNDSDRPRRK